MLAHLRGLCPALGGRAGRRWAGRFTRTIHIVDSTTIELIASCLDWARHRRRKAAAKCHLRLDLQSFLPRFVLLDSARHADGHHAWAVCAGLRAGEIVLFDRAYVDFAHLLDLTRRGVFWVTRAKENHQFQVVKRLLKKPAGKILRDDLVLLAVPATRALHPIRLRRVVALVEVDGKEVEMTFLTNHLEWAAASVVALYKCRWQIEVIKQTLQRADFLGNSGAGHARAGVDGAPGLCAPALPGGGEPVGPQLGAAVGGDAGGAVAAAGFGGAAQKLWDTGRELSDAGRARTGVFAGDDVRLWDSRPRGNAARTVAS